MSKGCLYAKTAFEPQGYVPFLTINEEDDGTISIGVRGMPSAPDAYGPQATIRLTIG